MLPWEIVETDRTLDGGDLVLARRGSEWEVRVGRDTLMSSRAYGSELDLARLAFEVTPHARWVLLGGLGLGFSLRSVLDLLPVDGRVELAEISDALVRWNREHVGELARHPLRDPRLRVSVGDVFDRITRAAAGSLDAILLDVDNGPSALVQQANHRLYGVDGTSRCFAALRPAGVLAVWSAAPDETYAERLRSARFEASVRFVRARPGGGRRHVVFVAIKPAIATQPRDHAATPSTAPRGRPGARWRSRSAGPAGGRRRPPAG
jgi:spermidine synthase